MTNETDKIVTQLATLAGYAKIMNVQTVEAMLDRGALCVEMRSGNWWRIRRNGRTQTWKTRPNDFRIPIKFGFKGTGNLCHNNLELFAAVDDLDALGIKHT